MLAKLNIQYADRFGFTLPCQKARAHYLCIFRCFFIEMGNHLLRLLEFLLILHHMSHSQESAVWHLSRT